MTITILDCYTDEAAGLGVPPYLGTYPRYIAGFLEKNGKGKLGEDIFYITIDDLRLFKKHGGIIKVPKPSEKTDISTYNLTIHHRNMDEVLRSTDTLIVILGIHVPGKYLSATPGVLHEVIPMIQSLQCKKILTGPAVVGTQLFGGKFFEKADLKVFDEISTELFNFKYDDVKDYALLGAKIIQQIPDIRIIEIETGHGCDIGKCSFCTEPLKNKIEFRNEKDILKEIKAFYDLGARYFRIGKQACFYTIPNAAKLLKDIRESCPEIKVLHIDNVNPVKVLADKNHVITKAIVKYCTSGNIAALGIESFDPVVAKENCLNCSAEAAYQAIKIINELGAEVGDGKFGDGKSGDDKSGNGMPRFLPGINIIFGLKGESKNTHAENMKWLKKIYDDGLMVRRINIRQVAIFEGTPLYKDCKDKFLRKNRRFYWKWRNDIRQNIDYPMLKRVCPKGIVLKECYAEIYDGKTTFCRQFGTYPIIIGVKGRLELKKFYNIEITSHMLRSITGRVVG